MPRFRVSIAGLSALVLAAGIVMAAARSPTEPWANGTTSVALLILGVAPVAAAARRGPGRAYWAGFAAMGWAYLALAFGPWADARIAPLLITKTAGEFFHYRFPSSIPIQPYARRIPGSDLSMFGYQQMAHSMTALLLGLLGGRTARRLARAAVEDTSGDRRTRMRTPPPVAAGLVALGMAGAILLAAIHPPGEFVGNGTFSAGLLALGLAAIAGATLRGADRAYWAGFALVGSGYLVLVYGPWFDLHTAPLLITETAFRGLEQRYGPYQRLFYGVVSEQGQFAPRLIGHTLSALILAAVGGEAARRFATAGPGVAVASEEGVG